MAGKREELLEVAARLIHQQGFNHTSLDQILQESKATKNLFYYHFKSKEELGMAILDHQAECVYGLPAMMAGGLDKVKDLRIEFHRFEESLETVSALKALAGKMGELIQGGTK